MIRFNNKYNHDDFLDFLNDFLPEDYTEKEEDIIIKKERYKKITNAKILGFSDSLDLYVLEMEHTSESDPRISIATDAFKILADHWLHKALVIFKNNTSDNYRFSYLTISLDINEKNKPIKQYSNARRYSFYLGTHAKVRTPEQQLIKKGRVKDIDDLFSRFSVEVVNKQFYLEVAKYFDKLVQEISLPSVVAEEVNVKKSFAVRLIGRLMFCWFLKQKKSDFGQLIPDEILSSQVVSENYYHKIIEPLFFEVLNTSIDSREIRNELFDKVPYLNGGLFNPQAEDFYDLDRDIFVSKFINTLKIDDAWFKNFFELLETYNFTIDENTVFDQELSVDPEMLGRIFENLLAEINPDTETSERKRTGSFYTPRQIVEYMVDQSLIEYLKIKTNIEHSKLSALISYDLSDDAKHPLSDKEKQDIIDAIEPLKILDPACGSGAYPIGALQKIVYILQQIDPDCKLWLEQKLKDVPDLYKQKIINEVQSNPFDYTRKLDVIKNSIFGVDIQPIAVDVSRLRCFLTLVVESEIDDKKQNRGIDPLPNLDFKFVCANTLIALPKPSSDSLFEDHSGIAELSGIMSDYFSCNNQRKAEIRLRFTNAQKEILNRTLSAFGNTMGELTKKLTLWDPFSNTSNSWFDPEWMFGLEEKFDIVIGNPPYGARLSKEQRSWYLSNFKTAFFKVDTYALFIEKAFELLKKDAILSYITPYTWLKIDQHKMLRKLVLSKRLLQIIDVPKKVFLSADLDTVVFVIRNAQTQSFYDLYKYDRNEIEFVSKKLLSDDKEININSSEELSNIIKKINNFSASENFNLEYSQGLIPYSKDDLIRKFGEKKGLEIIKKRLWNSGEYIEGFSKELRGSDIGKYRLDWSGSYIKYGDWLHAPRQKKFFTSPRIIIREITRTGICCAYSEEEYYNTPVGINIISSVNNRILLKMFCLILNSSFGYIYHRNCHSKATATTSIPKILVGELKKFPLPDFNKLSDVERCKIESLFDQILTLKKQNKDADTKNLELQIDQLVYKLYDLTPEEIEIVENSSK